MVTKDLISILDSNYAKGGEISTSSPYAIQKVDNWNQIPSTWKNTSFIKRVKYELDPFDDKFNSVFKGFLGEDELRPVMSGYNVDDYGITSTNAHILASVPAKLENKGVFNPATKKLIDEKYPNYQNIIPTEYDFVFSIDCYKLLQYCRVAINYASSYSKEVFLKYEVNNETLKIAFNGGFLINILESAIKIGNDNLFLHLKKNNNNNVVFSPKKNPILGEDILFLIFSKKIDDKRINNYDNVGAIELDFNFELSCIFDLSKNEIVNKDNSIVDFKMDYGVNPIFTDEVIDIIKTSLQKNPSLPILENFKAKNGSAFIVNIKNEGFSVTIPNINVPDSLYYIKNNVAVKNDYANIYDYVKDIDFSVLNKNNSIKINKDYFSYLINTAKLYVGNDELRPVMMGINFNYDGKDLYVASTNAHYLSRLKVEIDVDYENQNNFNFTFPVNNLVTLLESNEDEYITLDIYSSNSDKTKTPSNIVLKSSTFILRQRLIDGKYPIINQVIPYNTYYDINLNKKEILNAIKSKEVESFIKRNKKLTIVISAKKDNDRLSISLNSTSNSRDEFNIVEEIEILKTDLYLNNDEIPTTYSCLLLMPMISETETIFRFDLKLFKEFINPVNTNNFKISYTDKRKAYIINEEFFKYEEKSKKTKKAEKIIAPKIISKIEKKQEIKEIEKEENDLDYLNNLLSVSQDLLDLISDSGEKEDIDFLKEKIQVTKDLISLLGDNYANGGVAITPLNYVLEINYKIGQRFEQDVLGGTSTCYIKSINFEVNKQNGVVKIDHNSYRIEYVDSKGIVKQSHFSFLKKLKIEKNEIKIYVPYSIGSDIFFENSKYDNELKLLNGKVDGFIVLYYGSSYSWFKYYIYSNDKFYSVDSKDSYSSIDDYISRVSSKIKNEIKKFKEPKGGSLKVKLDYKIGQKIKVPIIGGFKDSEITEIDIVINAKDGNVVKDFIKGQIKYKNIYKEDGEDYKKSYIDFKKEKYTNEIENEITIDVKALYLEDYLAYDRYMDGTKLSINNVDFYTLKIDKKGYKVGYLEDDGSYKEIFTSIDDFKEKISSNEDVKKPKEEETTTENKSDLEYLKELLVVSQDLLDLIYETGEKEDIDFLKEKIKVTKDLISLLGDNYANGGGVTYPDLSNQKAQVVNDSIVLEEFSIKKNKNNFTINGFNKKIMSSDDAVKILREIWEDDTINAYEQAYILYFNKANSLIGYYHHSNGGIDGTVMDIQMICGLAVKSLAKGVIIAHNHPSENRQPSNADKQVSEQLKTALKTFNITLLDSMILTNDSYFSFADEGIL
jgi:DNA repair protein RadC